MNCRFAASRKRHQVSGALGIWFACLFVAGCGDECQEYSKYSCSKLEHATYYVWFRFPDGDKDYNLGLASGLAQCGSIASSYASSKTLTRSSGWSYVCCLKTSDSDCAEKHR
jgi:hypothetical protein